MKKLLGILVLGLLWCNAIVPLILFATTSAHADGITSTGRIITNELPETDILVASAADSP